jgi:imidazolonepropionase-like amidohydrolase
MKNGLALALLLSIGPVPPSKSFAIKDASVAVAPLFTLPRGTILIRDGLIEDVGPHVVIPPDAEVVDGAGLTVYAGFIDGRTTLGLPDPRRSAEERKASEGQKPDFVREAPPFMEPANRKGLRPELDAADLVAIGDSEARKAHAGGFTTAVVAASREYLAGRAAVISLTGAPRRETLIRTLAPAHASFQAQEEGYPSTSMGILAHLRQFFLDARRYPELWKAYKPGMIRPAVDRSLEAIQPILRREIPLFFEADGELEILRAIALSEEFGFRLGIVGGAEAWRVADLLKEKDIPVVLSLNLPKEPDKKKREDLPLKLRKERERLREEESSGARRLYEAKVPFCFSTSGLSAPADALVNLRKIIDLGLPESATLAALTTSPAKIFGLQATHGTIRKGKAATLTVLTAPLGDQKAKVRCVFVDGCKFEVEAGKPPAEPAAKAGPEAGNPETLGDPDVEIDADRIPRTRTGGSCFIREASLLGLSVGGMIDKGSIHVLNGRISKVGVWDGPPPPGIPVIDARGLFVMPGIIDAHCHLACEGGLNEGTQSITAEVRVADVLNPRDVGIYRAAAGGVTSAHVLHGSTNTIGGQNAVIKLKYGKRPREIIFPGAPPSLKLALGENPKLANSGPNRGKRFPNTRMGIEATLRRAFVAAREYEKAIQADPLARRDLRLEALLAAVRGETHLHCHAYRADEILMMLDVARDFGFTVRAFEHVLEGYKVALELAVAGSAASTFSDWWAYKIEAYDAIPYNAALLARAGVSVSINSDSDEQIRHLNVEAAKAVKYGGLSEKEALDLITVNPARQLGIDARAGILAAGMDADLSLFNGHPLSPYSRCVLTLVDGEVVFEDRDVPDRSTKGFTVEKRLRRAPEARLPARDVYAIEDALIHPVSRPPFRGTIVMRGGKIADLGPDARVPAGAAVIDGSGLSVYPGMIDALTHIGLSEIGSVPGTRDEAEIGEIQPDLKVLSAVNPHSEIVEVTRANGITAVLSAPQGGLIGGQSAVLRLDGRVPREMAVKEVFALHVRFPDLGGTEESKTEDEKRLRELREPFEAARRYDPDRGRDLKIESLLPYVRRERPVIFHADRAREIRAAVSFAGEAGLIPILSGGREAWKAAKLLADRKVPVILGGVMQLPLERHDPYDSTFASAARLSAAGVRFAVSSAQAFSGNSRNTPYHAAWAAAYGLDREEALKAVTLYPAEILGVADRLGSLEVGKDADLIVTTGDPLEVITDVVYMFIAGRPVSLESRHTRLYEKFRSRAETPRKRNP